MAEIEINDSTLHSQVNSSQSLYVLFQRISATLERRKLQDAEQN